jgi:hypothetical protein
MKKFVFPISLIILFLYSLSNWLGVARSEATVYNVIVLANLACLLCLIAASVYGLMTHIMGEKKVSFEEEDDRQLFVEQKTYNTLIFIQIALSISFVTFIAAFMLVRDTYPKVALYSILLFIASIIGWALITYLIRYSNPQFQFPDPNSPTYQQELFNSFDDGEKYLMLKGLYKLYYWILGLLVLLSFGLMFYSIFTGQSQLVAIIGIGGILLFIQTYYAFSLKPK